MGFFFPGRYVEDDEVGDEEDKSKLVTTGKNWLCWNARNMEWQPKAASGRESGKELNVTYTPPPAEMFSPSLRGACS